MGLEKGGDVYNGNGQWNTIALRNAIVDQAEKDANAKKHFNYYGSLYDVNQITTGGVKMHHMLSYEN